MEDQGYINRFVDVHEKVKAFKDRLGEANKSNAEVRENELVREVKKILDKEIRS